MATLQTNTTASLEQAGIALSASNPQKSVGPAIAPAISAICCELAQVSATLSALPALDAANITYTPAVLTDWDSDTDPGNTNSALNQLAERVDDNEILIAAHATRHTNGADDIQSATAAQKGLATAAQITKLDGIEALADVTDATNVNAAGAVMEADYNAQTILAATADNTPAALTVA
jgi:hypothetical protein